MIFQLVCLLLFPLIIASDNVNDLASIGAATGKSLNAQTQNQAAEKFWTADKFRSAKMVDTPHPKNKTAYQAGRGIIGPLVTIKGVESPANLTKGRGLSSNGRHVYTTGRIFWYIGRNIYSCTGSVIPSWTGDLILTSGSCLFNTATLTWNINYNWVFVPAYSNGYAPYGIWTPRIMWIPTRFATSYPDYNYDVGFVALNKRWGVSIQSCVGSQSIGFNWPRRQYTRTIGYSTYFYNGQSLTSCAGYSQAPPYYLWWYYGESISCSIGSSAPGAPRFQNFNDWSGIGCITSVNSFVSYYDSNTIFGPYFDSNIKAIYDTVQYG